jgi:hypothetical protein
MRIRCAQLSILWITTFVCRAQSLMVLLYDYAGLTAVETARATRVAAVPFRHATIDVQWVYCRGELASAALPACQTEPTANQVVVRLVRQEGSVPTSSTADLGHAVVGSDGGQYAAVFVPAVRARANEWNIGFDLVLGYAMAHEIGHCLLGPKHTSAGLMQARWAREDAREIAQLRLGLSSQEAKRATARLKAAGAPPASQGALQANYRRVQLPHR